MPKYRVNGDIYNIPEEKVSAFEKRYPNATVDIYDNDGAEYSLPVSEKVNFQKQFKNWSYTAPAAPSAPSAEEINSGSAGPVMPKPAMENRNWEVQMGNGHSRATVEKPEPVDVPIPQRPEGQEPSDDGTAAPYGDVRSYLENANRQQVANLSRDINSRLDEAQTKSRDIYMKEQEDARKGGFLSTLAHAIAASGHNPEGGSGGMSDAQQRTLQGANSELQSEISKLEAAKKAMSNAEEIIAEADKSVQEGKFPGFFKGVARGFGDKLFDVNTWDMGVSDTKNSIELLKALRKYDEGKPLSESEQMLLDAKSVELATNAYFGSYIGRGYKAGAVTAQSLPFMLEMAVNPASTLGESTQSMLARYALSRFAKKGATRAAQKFATKAAGAAGRALGDIAGSAVMAGTSGAVRVAGDAIDRHVGDIETDMDGQGQTVFAGHDPESLGKSIAKAFTSTAIENHSEMLGEYFAPALGIVSKLGRKGMEKFGLKNVVDFVDDVSATDAAKLIADFQKRTKWHGTIGEYAEEVVGNIENAILVGDSTLDSSDDTGVFNLDQNIDTFLGVALMGGVFSTIRTAAWRTPKYRARKEMEKARAKAKKKFGDQEWQDIEDRLAEAGDEGMSSVLSEVIIGERNPEREKAILDYAKSIKIYEGTLKGDEKHRELSSPEMTGLESSYENGYTLATPQEVHDAKIMFEYQQARLQQALGMSSIDIETLMLGNEMGKLTEEQKSVALDYLNAEATFDGVIDRVRDDIDNRISSVNAAIDASTNSDTGKLQPARLVDDRAVHIISGIVRLTPDGTMVDIHNSEDYIIIRDDKTGKIESVSPSQIVGVDAEIDPESEKKAAESQIRGQIGQQKADIIDGVLQFNPGDVYTLTNEQGQSFTVQIAADEQGIVDNGDGTINVILNEDIDANTGLPRISQMSKEQIENMAEATNMARLQQYEQQKLDVDARQYKEDSTGRTPENPFKINDRISFNDVGSGSVKHGIVESELTDDGKYEIAIENDGSIESVSYLSPEDLSNMQAQLVQSVEEQEAPEIEHNPVEIEQPEQPQVSAFERIPKDEQGNPIYEQAETPDLAWDAIVEQTDGDEAMAQTVADGMVADKETALKKIEKAKSKGGATIAEKIASEKERKAAIEEAKANLAVWKQIAQTARRRKDAEESEKRRIAEEQAAIRKAEEEKLRAEREEAERIKREALNGVPDISDDTPQDARARGYRRVSGHKVDRQEPIPHLQGNDIAVKFSDDVIVPGRVAVIEAETLQPSHIQGTRNPAHFIDESQPKERTDDASVLSARKIARNIRPEEITSSITAYTGAPTTNVRGEVIQGNNRSDALRLIWEGDKEQSAIYKQYLMDHAADFGLNADEISAMNHPVLVNMLDVDDATAITLGQFVAQDTESRGTERIKPKNAVQKMGVDMRTFADMLLASSDDETSFAGLVDRNGDEVLAWMNRRGFITPTQYKSAFDSKGSITAEAKNDLKGIMYQSIFTGGNIRLEEMFNAMSAKAQRAILATAFRDNESPNTERMVKEIQNSIRAYNALSQGEDFANAKNWKEARLAVESWKMQYAMDDVTGESYLPAEKFSNFALHLATMYKGESQSLIQSTFNHLYDLIQGTQEETLFEKPDNTPRTLAQAILETLNFEYDGQQRSNVLAGDSTASQEREQGSTGTPAAGERVEGGEQSADNTGGTENESGSGEVREKIAEEGSKVNTNPSDAQKEAGNYRMGHVKIDGMDVTIENPKGSIRKGRDADGKEWQSEMHNDYGYIRGTKAVDNDHIDIFLSDNPETGNVFVVDQVNPKTGEFDESKVMYGFASEQEARDAYLSNYEKGWKGLGKITEVTREEFKKWIDSSTRKTKPFSEYASVKAAEPQKEKPVQGIEGYSRDEIKSIVADHINDVMRDNDIHAEIIGMDIHGSRNRHDARPDSDLDVVVEYRGDIREDDMFNALNGEEDALSIEGIKVDINPIRKEETGDLQGYMNQSEEYDREKSEHAKQNGSSTTSEIKNNKSGKIEDYGEQISGARKDMLRDLAKSVQNTSLESLISLPFSKAFKKPNLRKAVEEGALRDKDARFAQAAIAAFLSTKKPVAGTKDERRRQRWGEKTNVEKWAEKAYTGIKMLQELFDSDERVRDKVIEAAVSDKYVGVDEAKAQQQRIGGLNHREFNGTSYPLNLIALYNEVFDRLGYPAGQNTKIPVGRIVCSSTFDSYSLRGVNGEDWIYPSRSLKSFEDVVDELVYLIKVANADETADHPIENFKIRGINPKVETTGYRVLAAKNLTTAITRGNRFAVDEIFPTREAAIKRIEELKATGLECSEPLEKRETVGYEKYQISFAHPITREFIPLDKEYGSKEDAIAAPEAEHEELNRLANEAIAAATKKSGESVEKSYFHITHYYDKGSDGKYHWYYGVALDDKYGPKKTAFNTMPFFLAERLNSREEAQKQIDANKERWESLVKDVVRQRSNFVYFSGDNETRKGEDYRNGKDVTAEEFANKFGFRGVQFGNWANQADRQAALNNAYDSFMDMSKIIGVSPKAMSLNGELGVAFGSRGSGAASAHYEPGEVVINLTKTRGAGSLAHEWWHALDNYFSRAANVKLGYVTSDKRLPMREEMRKAFNDLVDDVEKSDYHTRSMDRGSGYWGTRVEETARLFAEWIADEMAKRGELNNFLAGRNDSEDSYARMGYVFYKAIQKLKPEGEMMTFEEFRKTPMALKGFSYPTRAELEILGKDVRNIFGVVQERTDETTGNVALFQMVDKILSDNSPENRLAYEAVSQMLSNAGIPVELLSDQAMREMAINATMLDTALPEDESSFKGTVISSIDGANILNNLDKAIADYQNAGDKGTKTFLGDLASALGSSDKDKSSQYATFETKNGQVVTIRVSNHNATVSNFDNAGESNGISIVISRKPNEGMTNDGDAHIVEFFYPDKALNKAEGKPLVEILKSIKQSLYSGEYKDTTGLAQREEVNAKESVEFLREPDGTVYGATVGGKIYLNRERLNPNTPIHEYTHLWFSALEKANPELYKRGVELMKQLPIWEEVKTDPNYANLSGDDAIASECLSRLVGDRGADKLTELAKKAMVRGDIIGTANRISLIEDFKDWLKKFWTWVRDSFAPWTKEEASRVSVDDIQNMVLSDLAKGVNPLVNAREESELKKTNDKFNEQLETFTIETADRYNFNLGRPSSVLLSAGIENKPIRLHGSKVAKKIRKHGFQVTALRDLPKAIAHPIAVFDNLGREGNRSILTELKTDNGNVLVSIDLGRGTEVDFNIVSSAFGKNSKGVLGWINGGKMKFVDKEKALNYLHLSAPIAEASDNAELLSAANIVKEFENPSDKERKPEFQFIGEKGAAHMDKVEEATIRLDNLSIARQMEDADKDAKTIKLATGWERGADGKWRYEISDANIKDTIDLGKGISKKRFEEDMLWNSGRLGNVLEAPELFKAYPQLKDIHIETDSIVNDMPSNGEFNANSNRITIHAYRLKYLNSILNHEIQHAIQHIEGFATGGTPEHVEKEFDAAKTEWRARAYAHELEETAKELGGEYNLTEVENALGKEYKELGMEDLLPDKEIRIKGANYFARGYADRSMDEAIKRFHLDESTRSDFNSYVEYMRIAGEVEARNVSARLGMTPEERRRTLALETEDVSRQDQIILNDALNGDSHYEEEPEIDRIVREAKENGTYMKAPNGKPTNLNERQWAQVRTRAFKKWFGDWEKAAEESPSTAKTNSSKIVDENGEPKVVYHGSPYRFFRFDKTKLGQSTGADSAKEGFFFTDNKELAELFSRYSLESLPVSDVEQLVKDRLLNMSENELNDAYEVYRNDSPDYLDYADETDSPNDRDYLEIRGFLLDGVSEEEAKREYIQDSIESKIEGGYFSDMEEVEEELSSIGIEFGNNEQVFLNIESPLVDEVERDYFHNGEGVSPMTPVLQNAKRMGRDGVVFTGIVESGQKGAANQYVAFEPNQIKSATDNVGTFDVGQEDIRYRDSAQMDAEYMSAIEAGDMHKAGRMVEAAFRKAFPGSKVKNVVYHGVAVSEDGRQFPYNSIRDGHFTDDEGFAEYYAGSDGYVYKVFLDIESPLEQDFRGQNSDFARDAEGNDVSTRTFARRAKDSNGRYDGAIITNVDEYGDGIEADGVGNYDGSVTDYIPVSADQIYSAEPVVYDDNGQVIPLSRRFENGNPDIRYKHDETGNGNRTSQDIEAAATKLAESLGEKVRLVRDVNEIENQNKKVQENQRKSKGWFNTDTREIVVVLPNATGIEDVQATILHEAVGHKGLRELVGDDRFDDFLDKVYAAATKATRLEIVSLARRNHWDFRLATEEYIAGLAENGFAGRENRTLFEKIKDFFLDMLSRAKIALGFNIGDNELRYMLWRTYQMRTSRGILAKANDMAIQQELKVGNFREDNKIEKERMLWNRFASGSELSAQGGSTAQSNALSHDANLLKGVKKTNSDEEILSGDDSRLRFRTSANVGSSNKARDIYEEKTRVIDKNGRKSDTANLMRRLKEAYVDSMQSLKYLQDAISEETGKPVEDFENAYLAENSMSSKNKAQTDIYLNRFFNPIKDAIRDLQKEGTEYGDIVRYLMAKHGLERNEVFSKRDAEKDGVVWDGSVRRDYSGLTELTRRETDTVAPRIDEITSRAEDIVRKFEMDHDTDVLWEKINDATKDTLRTSYITGMLTKDNYEMVRSMFRYYIPLRGWSENTASAVYDYLSDARPKTSSIVKAATGRTTISDDPIATIAYMGQSAIIQGNRNMMKQKLLNLALNHKTGLLTVNRQWEVQDPVTGEWITRNPVIPVDATPEEVADIVSQFETDMKAAEKNGTARISRGKLDTGKHITAYEGQEHVVKVKRGGIEYCIYLNGNPRAAQAVNGMTNPDAVDSWLIRKARVIKNFMARMFTSQNPAFIISNLSRDVIFAGTAVFAKEDSKYTALYTKNIAKALAKGQLIGLVHRFETGRLDDSKDIDRYFGEFIRNGGETGFTQLNTVDDFKRDLNRFAREMKQGQVMKVSSKVWNGIWDGVEFMNRCAEDVTRFSVYMTSRQMGRSVERSISDAKEITVNFNRKGSGGFGARVMNFAYIFFNAAIQALANAGKIFDEHPVKSAVALSTFSAAGFLAPLLAQAIISAFGGDDDAYWDLPEWVRRNNFVFYIPWSDNKFLIIPISQELRPFYTLGEVAMSVLMGKEDVLEGLRSVGGSFMDLLPVDFMGNGNNLAVSLTPTVAQPFAQLVANSDYFGKPIYRRNDYNRLDPAWTKAYKGTSSMLINASKWLNEVTGGDDVKRGWIDPVNNPAVIEHLFESYLGGVGKTINKTAKTISMIWNPEMRDIRNVPIVSTFVQESDDERVAGSQLNREYVKAMEEFRETEHTISGYKRKARMGSMEYADKLSDFMNTPEFKKYSKMKGYASSIAKLRTALKKTEELNGNVMDAEYLQEMLRELKQQMLEELKED